MYEKKYIYQINLVMCTGCRWRDISPENKAHIFSFFHFFSTRNGYNGFSDIWIMESVFSNTFFSANGSASR